MNKHLIILALETLQEQLINSRNDFDVTDKVNEIEKEIKLIKTNFTKSKYYEL
tara:strand:+ start:325 stop:483 length:159 start_codon:yes stop_codon:yes gene_type:complete